MKGKAGVFLNFTLKIGLVFWLFSLCRILFFLLNLNSFPNPQWVNFLGGIRFDWMTIVILFSPFLISLFIYPFGNKKFQKVLYLLAVAITIGFNFLDLEYYKYTQKRTTSDIFETTGLEKDIWSLLPTFLIDFWYIFVMAILCFLIVKWLYTKIVHANNLITRKQRLIFSLFLIAFCIIGSRGGVQLRPLNLIAASQYGSAQNIPLVLNTPFTIIKTIYKKGLNKPSYFNNKKLLSLYSPIHQYTTDDDSIFQQQPNVILIIAESFSAEYLKFYNQQISYAPFVDSILMNSLVFPNSFANGKKSIEALPAILASVPTLMNTSYISSKYANNAIESLPNYLKKSGYSTHFFHGGSNGTMGFAAFTKFAGIDHYYGKNEYPRQTDYDGKWGIFDEPFLNFTAQELNKVKKPFFAGIFTLSSHHPYAIPQKYTDAFPKGNLPIHESLGYTDHGLRKFFQSIKSEPWFNNTIFIFTADHTQQNSIEAFNNPVGMYRVPIAFYSPKHIEARIDSTLISQIDIFPTLVDLRGEATKVFSFGTSVFDQINPHYSVSFLNGIYQLITEKYCLQFDGEQTIAIYNWRVDPPLHVNLMDQKLEVQKHLEQYLKAYIQTYNARIISNELTIAARR